MPSTIALHSNRLLLAAKLSGLTRKALEFATVNGEALSCRLAPSKEKFSVLSCFFRCCVRSAIGNENKFLEQISRSFHFFIYLAPSLKERERQGKYIKTHNISLLARKRISNSTAAEKKILFVNTSRGKRCFHVSLSYLNVHTFVAASIEEVLLSSFEKKLFPLLHCVESTLKQTFILVMQLSKATLNLVLVIDV